jgi:ABC-type transport system substrate-binding protein
VPLLIATAAAVAILVCSTVAAAAGSTAARKAGAGTAERSTLTVDLPYKVTTLDPDIAGTEQYALDALHLIAATLTVEPPEGGAIRPGLATSWSTSDGGLRLSFHLRSTHFTNGALVTASDVVASFERQLHDPADVNAGFMGPIVSVSAPNPTTAVFHLRLPYPSWPTIVSEPEFGIFPASGIANAKQFFKAPISDGPFKLVSWGGSDTIVMASNPSYYGGTPVVKKVIFDTVPDENTRLLQVESGQAQLADSVPTSALKQSVSGQTHVVANLIYGTMYLFVNDRKPPLNNVRVRQAMSLVVNRQFLNEITFFGDGYPSLSFFPRSMPLCNTKHVLSPKPQVAAAKRLLAGTPCAHGCSFTIMVRSALPPAEQMAVVLKSEFAQIGITANVAEVDGTVADAAESNATFNTEVNFMDDYADIPDGFLTFGLLSSGGVDANFSGYHDPAMDSAIRSVLADSGAARTAELNVVETLYAKDMPYLSLTDMVFVYATNVPSSVAMFGRTDFLDVSLH